MALWIVWAVLVLAALVSGVITSPVVLFGLVAGFAVLWRVMERR